jgi:dipeptidase D
MLNLDTEDWGEICIGCAGGGDSSIHLPINYQNAPSDYLSFQLSVEGLKGGHSGVDIHEERGNAIVFISSIIDNILENTKSSLASIEGGDKHNAIPREAFANIFIHPEFVSDAQNSVSNRTKALKKEFGSIEKNMKVKFTGSEESSEQCLSNESQTSLIGLLRTLPHGVLKYSHDVEGLVETSNNLASVKEENKKISIVCSTRSSISEALKSQRERIKIMSKAFGATTEQDEAYPGWAPNVSSPVLKTTTKIYTEILGKEPHICAIHAGLECGVIGEKVKDMDMVSFGPTIKGPHSPDERVEISSVVKFWE